MHGPEESRDKSISLERAIKHYIKLSSRQFHGYQFILAAYNIIARKKASQSAYLQCTRQQQNISKGEVYGAMSEQELALLGAWTEACENAQKHNRPMPPPPSNCDFFKTVDVCSGAMVHTNAHKRNASYDMRGYHLALGKSTLFVTFTPDDKHAFIIHVLNGGNSAATQVPPLLIRHARASEKPGAMALYHDHIVNVIIRYVLGWDRKKCKTLVKGGMFGHVKAFFGVNESQKRLALHAHVLVWLYGHDAIIERLQHEQGRRSLIIFLEKIVCASLPFLHSDTPRLNSCSKDKCDGKYILHKERAKAARKV